MQQNIELLLLSTYSQHVTFLAFLYDSNLTTVTGKAWLNASTNNPTGTQAELFDLCKEYIREQIISNV